MLGSMTASHVHMVSPVSRLMCLPAYARVIMIHRTLPSFHFPPRAVGTPSESSHAAILRSESPLMHRSNICGAYSRHTSVGTMVLLYLSPTISNPQGTFPLVMAPLA